MNTASRLLSMSLLALAKVATAGSNIFHVGHDCAETDIQHAIDAADDNDLVAIEPGTYVSQKLHIQNKTLRVFGNFPCDSEIQISDPGTETIISGVGQSDSPVISLAQSVNVQFGDLTITGGSYQGGILFVGHGTLLIARSRISSNISEFGSGGINVLAFDGSDPAVVNLILQEGTLVSGNYSGSENLNDGGGGIGISAFDGNTARLFMTEPQTAVAFNSATRGGGIRISGPGARADIGSPGYTDVSGAFYGAVSYNYATIAGGGIEVVDGGNVRLFSTQTGIPVRIENNGALESDGLPATHRGGGIYLVKNISGVPDGDAPTNLCGWGYSISGNKAIAGAAIDGVDSGVDLFRDDAINICGPEPATQLGAVECPVGAPCNHINDNRSSGDDREGIIDLAGDTFLNAQQVEMIRNEGSPLITSSGLALLRSCVAALNNNSGTGSSMVPSYLFSALGGATMLVDGCTITGNAVGVAPFNVTGPFIVERSVIWQPGYAVLLQYLDGFPISFIDVVTSPTLSPLPGGNHVVATDPLFVDSEHGNWHLQPSSPAIDISTLELLGAVDLDIEGYPRGFDSTDNIDGRRFDAGAYESRYLDSIFRSGFDSPP